MGEILLATNKVAEDFEGGLPNLYDDQRRKMLYLLY